MHTRLFRSVAVSCAAGALALSASSVAAAAIRPAAAPRLVAPAVGVPAGARALGAVPASRTLHFDVYLRARSASALGAYARAVTDPHSASYGHYLAPGAFARTYGASRPALARVSAALRADGLRVGAHLVDGLGLEVRGPAGTVERAFSTRLVRYHLAGGRVGTAAVDGLSLPASIAGDVLGVIGLDNLVHPSSSTRVARTSHLKWPSSADRGRRFASHASAVPGAPSVCPSAAEATEQGYGGLTDDQVAQAYGADALYGAGDLGAGQSVAVYELEPFALSDVAQFDQCYFGTDNTANITTINVDGGPGQGYGSGESALDIENVSALAPQAHIDVYQGPNSTSGALDTYGQIVSDDTARVVTTSWGLCETAMLDYSPGSLDVEHLLFEQAAAQGQSVFASAGDDGADDCAGHGSSPVSPVLSVDDPSSQPYVVSVGGTTAVSVAHPPLEQVWNDGAEGGAGGGGSSLVWAMPSWQSNVSAVAAASTSSRCGSGTSRCRVSPDVSAFADEYTGITISWDGGWYTIGGTSSSAPIWAGLLAEINASAACQSSGVTADGVGFVSPLLYEVGANPTLAAESFNDVTTGNNDIFSTNGGAYQAASGYDAASGLGTPNLSGPSGTGLASTLCDAAQEATTSALSSVSPSSGTVAGGTRVTIHGTGFMTGSTVNVKGVSFGDFPAASFSVTSASTIVARTAPAGVPRAFGKTVSAGTESLVEVTYKSGHVAVGPTYSYLPSVGSLTLPQVLSVGPSGGPVAGGNTVSIYGTGLAGATAVTFGGVDATSFVVKSDSLIEAVAPPEGDASCLRVSHTTLSGLCQSQVVVTTASGVSAMVPALKPLQGSLDYNNQGVPYAPAKCRCEVFPTLTEYDYQAAPTVTSITDVTATRLAPLASPEGVGLFALKGTGFNYLTLDDVAFGDATAQSSQDYNFFSVSSNEILIEGSGDPEPSPAGNDLPVTVVTQGGDSSPYALAYGGVPEVDSVSSSVLSSSGGTLLTLSGDGFSKILDVEFVSVFGLPSTLVLKNFHVQSSTQITVLAPSLVPGSYFVSVDNRYGNSSLYTMNLSGPNASYQTLAYTATNVTVVYPGGAALTGSAGGTTCSVAGGCSVTLSGVNLFANGALTAYVGTQVAAITNEQATGDVDTVTITVPPAFLGVAGTQPIILQDSAGTTPDTLEAIETYT
jgi:hypothetical protein